MPHQDSTSTLGLGDNKSHRSMSGLCVMDKKKDAEDHFEDRHSSDNSHNFSFFRIRLGLAISAVRRVENTP